ncbi:MAG: hypothetical protein CMJ78_17380 [Planctomycetaceae bacterium]|nr:hypothetical protein [Planctomycetaceae bacterium]
MLGWLDSDQDGIFDVLDVNHTLTGTGEYTPETGIYRFTGNSSVNTLENLNPNGNGNDITINKITRTQFRIDGGDWTDAATHDAAQTNIDVTFVAPPNSTVEIRTIDHRSGVTSNVISDDSTSPILDVEFSAASVAEAGLVDITITRVTTDDVSQPLVVNLDGNDDSEMQFPDTVTILGGQTSVVFQAVAEDDDIIDGTQDVTLTATATDFAPGADSIDVTDNDVAGFTVAETNNETEVTEAGSEDTLTVVLNAQPDSNVVIEVVSGDAGEATVDPAVLTFTPNNWNQAQTVTVTGEDDNIDDGNVSTAITLSINDTQSDNNFDNVVDQVVDVTTVDDDTAGFTIVETNNETEVSENGTGDLFTIVLNSEPVSPVVIEIENPDQGEVDISPVRLTFTSNNWDAPQEVNVLGVDDMINDGDEMTTLRVFVVDAQSDNAFDNVADQNVVVTTIDNDSPAFIITETNNSTVVSENGNTDTFSVVLQVAPLEPVVISVSSNDEGEATVGKAVLSFTPQNWDDPQIVTVIGEDDEFVDGDQASLITLSIVDAQSDDEFDNLADQIVDVLTDDDDDSGFTIVETDNSSTVSEAGQTDTLSVTLDHRPLSDVVIDVASLNTGELEVDKTSLVFTTLNWDVGQTVTLSAVDEQVVDGDRTANVRFSINDDQSNDLFDLLADQFVDVTVVDDDVPGFLITQTGNTVVNESGTEDTFTVVLTRQPLSDVVLTVASSDEGEASVDAETLTFTPNNWDQPQTVTVTGEDDLVLDGTQITDVVVSVLDSQSHDAYDDVADQSVAVITNDNDVASFSVVASGGTTRVSESGTTDTLSVVLDVQPLSTVVIEVESQDTDAASVDKSFLQFTSKIGMCRKLLR